MKLTRQRINELRKVFRQVDKDDTELLDKNGLEEALSLLGYENVHVNQLLKLIGREQEGFVIFDDFKDIVALNPETLLEESDHSNEVFQQLADPEFGGITLNRLQCISEQQGHEWSPKEIKEMMDMADGNHDGIISLSEFRLIYDRVGYK